MTGRFDRRPRCALERPLAGAHERGVPEPLIELRGLTKRHARGAVVGPIDLSVERGRTLALIGPSGSGKSTVLRVLLGLVRPDEGEIRFGGAPPDAADPAFRRRIGYVVQGGGLFPHLTAAENASLVARWLGWDAARVAERLEALSALTRFPREALLRHPRRLSGGQAQRVSLMRALFLDPEVLFLDEPLGALDPITRADLQADLRRAFDDLGKTVVLVTHDLAEASFLAHRLALLRDGRVAQEGTLDDLVRRPADPFVTRFVRAQRTVVLPPEAIA
jgi:osmoprotectant transport system ATP-binding protein